MHARGKNRGSMHKIVIRDGELLRHVLRTVLKYCGTHAKAAERLGIGQTTFTRLLNGDTSRWMTFATYENILHALKPEAFEFGLASDFENSILSWYADQVRMHYEDWVEAELGRRQPKVEALFFRLFEDPTYHPYFKRFLKAVRHREDLPSEKDRRVWLALYRCLESLQDSEATWEVERSLDELEAAGHLESYLRHSLECERIMLARERDMDRFRGMRPPEEVLAWLAEEIEPTAEEVEREKAGWARRAEKLAREAEEAHEAP